MIPSADGVEKSFMFQLSSNKFYVDEWYEKLIVKPLFSIAGIFYRFIELAGIDKLVNSIGSGVVWAGSQLRLIQTGNTGLYIFYMVAGIILLFLLNFF
jgi:NADH-quinone oxidoreductase subunit L